MFINKIFFFNNKLLRIWIVILNIIWIYIGVVIIFVYFKIKFFSNFGCLRYATFKCIIYHGYPSSNLYLYT